MKPGDRVALVFRPDEAPSFVSAFYGCIIAAVVPVCIEPPITKEVCMFVFLWVEGTERPSRMAHVLSFVWLLLHQFHRIETHCYVLNVGLFVICL